MMYLHKVKWDWILQCIVLWTCVFISTHVFSGNKHKSSVIPHYESSKEANDEDKIATSNKLKKSRVKKNSLATSAAASKKTKNSTKKTTDKKRKTATKIIRSSEKEDRKYDFPKTILLYGDGEVLKIESKDFIEMEEAYYKNGIAELKKQLQERLEQYILSSSEEADLKTAIEYTAISENPALHKNEESESPENHKHLLFFQDKYIIPSQYYIEEHKTFLKVTNVLWPDYEEYRVKRGIEAGDKFICDRFLDFQESSEDDSVTIATLPEDEGISLSSPENLSFFKRDSYYFAKVPISDSNKELIIRIKYQRDFDSSNYEHISQARISVYHVPLQHDEVYGDNLILDVELRKASDLNQNKSSALTYRTTAVVDAEKIRYQESYQHLDTLNSPGSVISTEQTLSMIIDKAKKIITYEGDFRDKQIMNLKFMMKNPSTKKFMGLPPKPILF